MSRGRVLRAATRLRPDGRGYQGVLTRSTIGGYLGPEPEPGTRPWRACQHAHLNRRRALACAHRMLARLRRCR